MPPSSLISRRRPPAGSGRYAKIEGCASRSLTARLICPRVSWWWRRKRRNSNA